MRRLPVIIIFLLPLFLVETPSSRSFADLSQKKGGPVEYGNWTFKTMITIKGVQGIPPRSLIFEDCLTAHHRVPARLTKNCSITTRSIAGKTLSYTMTCAKGISRARFTYGKRHLVGTIETRLRTPEALTVLERIQAHYTGPCPHS